MIRFPNGAVRCPKCGCSNVLRALFFLEEGTGFERIKGTCSRCGFHRHYHTRDHEGSA